MIIIFDMDGTLTEPWYGRYIPHFYANEEDMVTRATMMDTYTYVKPLPYIETFLQSTKEYYEKKKIQLELGVATRILNGAEYINKVDYLERKLGFDRDKVYGLVSEEDKLRLLEYKANQDNVIYVDDTVSTINSVHKQIRAKNHILCIHATSLMMHSIEEIDKAYQIEESMPEFRYYNEISDEKIFE